MNLIQNKCSISYAGAYLKYGFHKDGFTSGLLAACSVEDKTLYKHIHAWSSSSGSEDFGKIITTKNMSVWLPFNIQFANHHLFIQEGIVEKTVAGLFSAFEASGCRYLTGILCGTVLQIMGCLVGATSLWTKAFWLCCYNIDAKFIVIYCSSLSKQFSLVIGTCI